MLLLVLMDGAPKMLVVVLVTAVVEVAAAVRVELPPNVVVVVVVPILLNKLDELEPNTEVAAVLEGNPAESVFGNPARPEEPNKPPDDVVPIEKVDELVADVEAARLLKRPPPLLPDVTALKENVDGSEELLSDLAPNKPLASLLEVPPRLNENPALPFSEAG